MLKSTKLAKFTAFEIAKTAVFALPESTKLISRKISVIKVGFFVKLWRAVKKVVDFPNSTLNYKITPPLKVSLQGTTF